MNNADQPEPIVARQVAEHVPGIEKDLVVLEAPSRMVRGDLVESRILDDWLGP